MDTELKPAMAQPSTELLKLLDSTVPNLMVWMETLVKSLPHLPEKTLSIRTLEYWAQMSFYQEDHLMGEVRLSIPEEGGFVLRRSWLKGEYLIISFDIFNAQGVLIRNVADFKESCLQVEDTLFDPHHPLINYLYQYLAVEYKTAQEGGNISTKQTHTIETYLRRWSKDPKMNLSINAGASDEAYLDLFRQVLILEANPVLNWEERQVVIAQIYEKLADRIGIKARAHGQSAASTKLWLLKARFKTFIKRLKARPKDNLKGLFVKYTIGKIIWFFQTVKNNLGYSIALAVYGPFTYYFITMPMNPHAMSAVGRVRTAYLEIKQAMVEKINTLSTEVATKPVIAAKAITDQVSTTEAKAIQAPVKEATFSQIIGLSDVSLGQAPKAMVLIGDEQRAEFKPQWLNLILSTDVPLVDQQTWIERMSRFKNMQIAFEENMEYAPRMGRLEQLETQYNFPMMVESTWEELERYTQVIFKIRAQYPQLSPKFKQYLVNEVNRAQQLQLYLWDRMARFILDQPYVMLDQDKEQKRNDYYVGRSFVFMEEMTQVLSWRYENLKLPHGYEKIKKLATVYKEARKEYGNILTNLKNNSDLFKQKDLLSTTEFRSYMKRQWEILFLQNAKAEEASNNGLNMYIWSVRNTIWVLQSLYSTRREDLEILLARDQKGLLSNEELWRMGKIEMMYETLIHNLTLEYVGIRQEINERLGKDIESIQRQVVLNNLKEFVVDRNKLLNKHQDDVPTLGSHEN
jgi:hypothetical protein